MTKVKGAHDVTKQSIRTTHVMFTPNNVCTHTHTYLIYIVILTFYHFIESDLQYVHLLEGTVMYHCVGT